MTGMAILLSKCITDWITLPEIRYDFLRKDYQIKIHKVKLIELLGKQMHSCIERFQHSCQLLELRDRKLARIWNT